MLKQNRDALYDEEHQDHETVSAKLSFLYRSYEEDAFYWEASPRCYSSPSQA